MQAIYFDGHTSKRHPVHLLATPGSIELTGDNWNRREPLTGIRVSEPIGAAPRTLNFPDGSFCEVAQGGELNALLATLGHRDRAVTRWQQRWSVAAGSLMLMIAILLAAYRWGLPWFAARAAPMIPPAAVSYLSQRVVATLDAQMLKPSHLPPARQQALAAGLRRLSSGDPALANSRLLFRDAPRSGPNAFALPDGEIVLFDDLVTLADNDEQVLGVLAHELAHVKFHHGLRQVIQSSVVGAVVASYFGDLSTLLSGLTAVVIESKYSREFEQQADDYAAILLRQHDMSPTSLATILEKMEGEHVQQAAQAKAHTDWLADHPETAERIRRLRAER
jgi:Zn-dependent protease with chaperone function